MNTPRRVAFLLPDLGGGGTENVVTRLACGMSERGIPVDFLLGSTFGPFVERLRGDIRVHDLGVSTLLAGIPRLARLLDTLRPEVLISALPHANLAASVAAKMCHHVPRLFLREENQASMSRQRIRGWSSRLGYALAPLSHRLAHQVICVSRGVAADLHTQFGIPTRCLTVIVNPVLGGDVEPRSREIPEHPWCRDDGDPVVLAVGRLTEQKNFPLLIDAFALAAKRTPMRLLILGEGPARAALQARVHATGLAERIALPGFLPNPFAHMRRAGVFALSSAWEGLPTVLIEALACGVPIVATDCPSGPREILAQGRFGTLVPVGRVDTLADALVTTLGQAGRGQDLGLAQHLQQYTVATAVDAHLRLISARS